MKGHGCYRLNTRAFEKFGCPSFFIAGMASSKFLVIFLTALRTVLGTKDDLDDQSMCSRNRSLLEIPGDAVLSGKES